MRKAPWLLGLAWLVCGGLLLEAAPSDLYGRTTFVSLRGGTQNIWIQDLKTMEATKLTDFPADRNITTIFYPQWSLDGKSIAFTGRTPESDYSGELYLIDVATKQVQKLTSYPDGIYVSCLSWDPVNPDLIYYLKVSPGSSSAIRRLNLATGSDDAIPNSSGSNNQSFDITPDGSRILFGREPYCCWTPSMYMGYQNMAGTGEVIIKPTDGNAEWLGQINPVDEWIVYFQGPGSSYSYDIYKMDPDGHNVMRLTSGGAENSYPVWAGGLNGGMIIFQTSYFGNYEIAAMMADGASYPAGLVNLTQSPGSDLYPDWTPTGWNSAPIAAAKDLSLPADESCQAYATALDFDNGSSDPDGDEMTFSVSPEGPFPLGETAVTLTVTDEHGALAQAAAKIIVYDETAPVIQSMTADPAALLSPNHKMVPVTISVSATDGCSGPVTSRIMSVGSNEPEDGLGDGDTGPDWEITSALTLNLRAERSGSGDGRIYTIMVECKDAAGNIKTGSVTVVVPKSKGR